MDVSEAITSEFLESPDGIWWLAWLSVPGIGQATFRKILTFCKQRQVGLKELWNSGLLQVEVGLSAKQQNSLNSFKITFNSNEYIDRFLAKKQWLLSIENRSYPEYLKAIPDPPWLLFGQGPVPNWERLLVAVVGTRHPTAYGEVVTRSVTTELTLAGACIVSGFMYGIDTIAHQAALEAGGASIGVLGYGFDHITPRSHRGLFQRWQQEPMTFMTEFAPHIFPQRAYFPLRNRIVAGLSQAVVVTEAGSTSGSHITASLAAEYGRAVGAVPGPITSPYSEGTKTLINSGAVLVSQARDILDHLGPEEQTRVVNLDSNKKSLKKKSYEHLPSQQRHIAETLSKKLLTSNEIARELDCPMQKLTVTLSYMELAGIIERRGEVWQLSR